MDMLTLTRRYRGIPCIVAIGGLLAHGRTLPDQLVAPVAGPAHHAVKMTPGLAHHKAVLRGVRGAAVHRYSRCLQRKKEGETGREKDERH